MHTKTIYVVMMDEGTDDFEETLSDDAMAMVNVLETIEGAYYPHAERTRLVIDVFKYDSGVIAPPSMFAYVWIM